MLGISTPTGGVPFSAVTQGVVKTGGDADRGTWYRFSGGIGPAGMAGSALGGIFGVSRGMGESAGCGEPGFGRMRGGNIGPVTAGVVQAALFSNAAVIFCPMALCTGCKRAGRVSCAGAACCCLGGGAVDVGVASRYRVPLPHDRECC